MELRAGISQAAIEQWGYLQKQAEKWIYPIPVLEAFIATKTCISNNHSAAGYVGYWTWDKDITTEYAYSWNNYPSYCFMIGKVQQQWGKILGDTVNLKVIDFPVPFNECFGGVTLFNGDPVAAAEYATITDITNANFKIYMYANNAGTGYANANIFYLFLGT